MSHDAATAETSIKVPAVLEKLRFDSSDRLRQINDRAIEKDRRTDRQRKHDFHDYDLSARHRRGTEVMRSGRRPQVRQVYSCPTVPRNRVID
jgi:hypothetical protein